ncbi:MAG: PAS domain S-box protein, partial [Anaerolineales bacterium]|nr:PAS domain S-box protein [Anaerolineales bacterium]
ALFQGTPDGILIADLGSRMFRYANPAVCRLLGYSEAELRTMSVADIHPKADLPAVLAEFEAQARGDKILAAGLPCLRKDGTIVHADVSAAAMSVDGRACVVGFFRDITERRQAEEQLNEHLDELRRWHKSTLGREMRVLDLKREVNELLAQTGLPPRYHSPETEAL